MAGAHLRWMKQSCCPAASRLGGPVKEMRVRSLPLIVAACLLTAAALPAQTASPAPTSGAASSTPSTSTAMNADVAAFGNLLGRLQDLAGRTNSDLGKLHIDKWKADSGTKQQTQSNTAALQRNLASALPEMIQKAQAAPQELGPGFKLYRNLDVLYDVLAATAENAGAFGPKEQYDPLASDASELDQLRHSLADRLDWLAGVKDGQLTQLRQQLAASQQQLKSAQDAAAAAAKKPAAKPAKKKKPATE